MPEAAAPPSYLIRCLDGPARGDYTVAMPWPLPSKLVWFPLSRQLVDYASTDTTGEPMKWPDDLGLTFYEKVTESELPDDVDEMSHVMRGARYRELPEAEAA